MSHGLTRPVNAGGTINIDAFSTVTSSAEAVTITKPMTIQAIDGKISIGGP